MNVEERWTIPLYNKMQQYWIENGPPVYMAVAGYLGLINKKKEPEYGTMADLAALLGGGVKKKAG